MTQLQTPASGFFEPVEIGQDQSPETKLHILLDRCKHNMTSRQIAMIYNKIRAISVVV